MIAATAGGVSSQPSYVSGWSISRLTRRLLFGLAMGLVGGLVVGLVAVLAAAIGVVGGPVEKLGHVAAFLLLAGVVFGVVYGLAAGLVVVGPPLDRPVEAPTYWLVESAKAGLIVGPIVGLMFGLAGVFAGLSIGLTVGLFFGPAAGLWHVVLRLRCWRRGLLPLRLVRFLDWGVDHFYLKQAGAAYRWFHPTLADYLAESFRAREDAATRHRSADAATSPSGTP